MRWFFGSYQELRQASSLIFLALSAKTIAGQRDPRIVVRCWFLYLQDLHASSLHALLHCGGTGDKYGVAAIFRRNKVLTGDRETHIQCRCTGSIEGNGPKGSLKIIEGHSACCRAGKRRLGKARTCHYPGDQSYGLAQAEAKITTPYRLQSVFFNPPNRLAVSCPAKRGLGPETRGCFRLNRAGGSGRIPGSLT